MGGPYPSRIVCLTEETTETLYLLGEGDRVVGVSGYTVRPPEARQKPRVSAFINARFDKIEALRPDLILAFSDLQADIAAELARRGYNVVLFNQRSVVVRRAPDVIVASWCGKAVKKNKIASRPGWDALPAVRAGRIHEIKSAYILQPGPASLTEGIRQLQEILTRVRVG
jgi:iron complex transport system substrate-binding protein